MRLRNDKIEDLHSSIYKSLDLVFHIMVNSFNNIQELLVMNLINNLVGTENPQIFPNSDINQHLLEFHHKLLDHLNNFELPTLGQDSNSLECDLDTILGDCLD